MTTLSAERVRSGTTISIRDVSLFVDVVGRGHPLVLMHGGPGADHYTMLPFRRCKDRFTLVFYDHRGNGRSTGAPVSSMTWENLTADADALRQKLGFDKWAVLGHSFGGQVALEYALRYPDSLSRRYRAAPGATAVGHSRTRPTSSPSVVTALRRWSWSGAGSTASSHRMRCSGSCCGSGTPTTTIPVSGCWPAK